MLVLLEREANAVGQSINSFVNITFSYEDKKKTLLSEIGRFFKEDKQIAVSGNEILIYINHILNNR